MNCWQKLTTGLGKVLREQDFGWWCHSLHTKFVHLQKHCKTLLVVTIMDIQQKWESHYMVSGHLEYVWCYRRSSWGIASQWEDGHRGQDEKVVLIVHEMKGYNLKLAALQERKCFSDEVHTKQEESLCWQVEGRVKHHLMPFGDRNE